MSARRCYRVQPARAPLKGRIRVPGDKSIGHRALILGALADGTSHVRGLSDGADNRATRAALQAMGVAVRDAGDAGAAIEGVGLDGLRAAAAALDCGNSGTTMRLLCGLLAGQRFASTLVGDASLSKRPMARITRPLRSRGARLDGALDAARNDEVAPIAIRGLPDGMRLGALEYALPVASAQVKSAMLLSGLYADGPTLLQEPVISRDHTERMLDFMGVPIQAMGPAVMFDPEGWNRRLAPFDITVPGDPSSAAFVVVAAHLVAGSKVLVHGVCTNPTRTGALDVLRDMGGGVVVEPKGGEGGEPVGDLYVGAHQAAELRGPARVGGELAVRSIDEIPALVAAAVASPRGTNEFRDLTELRVKETDRVEALVAMLTAFGIGAEALPDGLRVQSGQRPRGGARVDSHGDHRIAMAACVLALVADGETVVEDTACVDTSWPGFVASMRALGASIEVEESGA